ncbi:NAD(P)/FAD-dependent oxidoreductase [Qipengyuania spongiae]|uniref:FAD-dependent oxidoreductase n=1 Tax=Qipengyuania spongiae TaxID=2909673 RepID=A0ABY5T6C2_9SPHN|nr:FAD-dependent oxidoreductase [Qipengyuania spongiae]UVI40504.1 FAD-dependent oxidoreductase [Qipengyuania spongiae]
MPHSLPTIVLLGAGHAHLGVIDDWLKRGPPEARTVLVEPRAAMQYSGMVPGWLAGEYRRDETDIALAPLVAAAGIEWRRGRAVAIDPGAKTVLLETGERIGFDFCSIATGGAGQARDILGDDPYLIDIRPIDKFMNSWTERQSRAPAPRRIAVVGGGAGGVELAFGLCNSGRAPEVLLATGAGGLLPGHGAATRHATARELERQSIQVIEADARFEGGALTADGVSLEPLDCVIAAIGSGAPAWPRESGLPVDENGFIRVGPTQQVEGFPHILAAGDIARRTDRAVRHSGVHAVYAGPVLARNLRRLLAGHGRLARYSPLGMDFYLLNTCRGASILSYGPLGFRARWLRRMKDWLDRRWIARFSRRRDAA